MLDIRLIRKDPLAVQQKLQTKIPDLDLSSLLELDERLRHAKTEVEELKAKRNSAAKEIGEKKQKKMDCDDQIHAMRALGDQVAELDHQAQGLETQLNALLAALPNLPMDDIPVSLSAADNVLLRDWGKRPEFDFPFRNHVELNQQLHFFDFARGAKIAGSGWPVYTGLGARLEWALLNYMLDIHRKNGFTQIIPPLLVRPETMYGAGQLPKFEHQLFKLKDEDYHLYLIPTSEVALNGLHAGETLSSEELPLKYTAYTPCFRREAGAAGSQERGLIRMHQFNKVEMFCLTAPEDSSRVFEEMLASAEEVLQGLELHYRLMLLTTGDMSFAAGKTIDIEAWLPGQNRYYEVSSVSNCTDFQARRADIRFRSKEKEKNQYVHTLNGSGLATSRLMVALLENNQQANGTIRLPKVLERYLEPEVTQFGQT